MVGEGEDATPEGEDTLHHVVLALDVDGMPAVGEDDKVEVAEVLAHRRLELVGEDLAVVFADDDHGRESWHGLSRGRVDGLSGDEGEERGGVLGTGGDEPSLLTPAERGHAAPGGAQPPVNRSGVFEAGVSERVERAFLGEGVIGGCKRVEKG